MIASQTHMVRFSGAMLSVAILALSPAAAAGAKKPTPGLVYGGTTSQDSPFVLQLRRGGRAVDHAAIIISTKCSDGQMLQSFETLSFDDDVPAFIGQGHHFFANGKLSRQQTFKSAGLGSERFGERTGVMIEKFKGRLMPNGVASGSYSATMDLYDEHGAAVATCKTGIVRWTARSAKGQVYAGSTSQDQSVVIELDRQRRKVTDLRVGWGAACVPSGSWLIGDHLISFPISGDSFGDAFRESVDMDGGGKRRFGYAIKGRVGKTKASGRLSVNVDDTDGTGAATSSCRTGSVTWSATSG